MLTRRVVEPDILPNDRVEIWKEKNDNKRYGLNIGQELKFI